jgi:hypothetical protein
MKNRLILSVFFALAAIILFTTTVVFAEVTNGGDDVVLNTAVTNGSDDGAGFTPTSGTVSAVGSVTNGTDDAAPVTPVDPTPVTTSVSGPSFSGTGGSLSRPLVFIATYASSHSALASTSGSCPLITTSILKIHGTNDSTNVRRLQTFLKDSENADVTISGTFDEKTEDAVKAFQIKYKDIILAPWGATKASGIAYITTIKKINELACKQGLTLSPEELSIINAYQAGATQAASTVDSTSTGTQGADEAVIGDATSTEANDNTANAANASILRRFWNFSAGLFR